MHLFGKAKRELLKFNGVGNKVASMFLLYGLGLMDAVPVDRWINRIISKVYFNDKKKTNSEVEDFFQDYFGKYGGLAQIYLFHSARTGFL